MREIEEHFVESKLDNDARFLFSLHGQAEEGSEIYPIRRHGGWEGSVKVKKRVWGELIVPI